MACGSLVSPTLTKSDIIFNSNFVKNVDKLAFVKGGLLRNVTRRSILAQDEAWWNNTKSDWKLVIEHPYAPAGSILPDYWEDRVLDLLECEITYQNFGFTFDSLMQLDPATFEKIERRVEKYREEQHKRMKSIENTPPGGNNKNG